MQNNTNDNESPCVRNCCLNKEDICIGCGRAITEITQWSHFSDSQKRIVKLNAQQRLRVFNV